MNSPTRLVEFSMNLEQHADRGRHQRPRQDLRQPRPAARKPSPSVGVSPLKRMMAQLTRAELQKTTTK